MEYTFKGSCKITSEQRGKGRKGREMVITENAGGVVAMETEEKRKGRSVACLDQR